MQASIQQEFNTKRLASLDFMRGLIMFLLALEAAGLYDVLQNVTEDHCLSGLIAQFHHHPWNGLRFWDLIQPGFMFIAGTAMAYSIEGMKSKALGYKQRTSKMLKRCGWLFFWGVLIYAVKKDGLAFELWNVLTQLSFTIAVAYFIFEWKFKSQLLFSIGLLLLTEILYRFMDVPGYNQTYVNHYNFGNYVDMLLMGKTSRGGWVAINCIPTAVHTIAGALVGKYLMSKEPAKTKQLLIWGIATLAIGYGMDLAGITPIIKRIATSSFTIVSLGWCLLGLAACYFYIDVKGNKKGLSFLSVLGMNSIFIYLFFEIVGGKWFNGYVSTIAQGLFHRFIADNGIGIISSITIFFIEWKLCEFLYKKKIFFRL